MDTIRLGLIGTGSIAQVAHLPIIHSLPDVELAGICDVDAGKLESIARMYNVPVRSRDYREFVRNPDIDAFLVATPTDAHLPVGKAALEAGKPVLIEKPIARTVAEARTLADAARKAGLVLMVGMNHRFRQDVVTLKSFIQNGELGSITMIQAGWMNYQSSSQQWIRRLEKAGGGVFLDLGIVMLDLVLWLLDFPTVQTASANMYFDKTKTVEDSVSSFLRLDSGASVSLQVSWTATVEENQFHCDVIGTKGSAQINPLRIRKIMAGNPVNVTPVLSETKTMNFKKSYERQLKHFLNAVRGLQPAVSDGREAVYRMKIVDTVYASAKRKREIAAP